MACAKLQNAMHGRVMSSGFTSIASCRIQYIVLLERLVTAADESADALCEA